MKNLIREYQIKWANGIVELGKTRILLHQKN